MDAILGRGLAKLLADLKVEDSNKPKPKNSLPQGPHSRKIAEYLLEVSSFFDAQIVLSHIQSIEPDRAVLKKEIKSIMKMYMSDLMKSDNVGEILNYLMLCGKYRIKEAELCSDVDISFGNFLWTFPDFCFYQMKKHPQFKFPWSDSLIRDFPTLKVVYHNPGLLGMIPKAKKYGGFAKALVYLAYLVSVRVKDINICIAISYTIYNTSLASDERREKWFPNLEITEEDCAEWSKIFDRMFPKHTDAHKYFDQIA